MKSTPRRNPRETHLNPRECAPNPPERSTRVQTLVCTRSSGRGTRGQTPLSQHSTLPNHHVNHSGGQSGLSPHSQLGNPGLPNAIPGILPTPTRGEILPSDRLTGSICTR